MGINKIAIDVSPLYDGNSQRGVGHYTQNLIEAIKKVVKSHPDYRHFQVDLVTTTSDLQSKNYDLIHYPYFDPFKLTLPFSKTPFLVTVHDLTPIEFSSHYPRGLKGEIKWQIQRLALRRSRYIITVSHYARHSISRLLPYPSDRIFVTYEAANKEFKPRNKNSPELQKIKTKYQLPDKFVLYIGDLGWNKNVPLLVKTCFHLNIPIVIVGAAAVRQNLPNHPEVQDILWLQQQKSPLLKLTGFVPDDEAPLFFNLATLYCQPSFSEGFGLPPLEAMQSACPTLVSHATSLPEIAGPRGYTFNPHSPADLETKLKDLYNSPQLQSQISQDGLKRSACFSWEKTALETLAVYRLALTQHD